MPAVLYIPGLGGQKSKNVQNAYLRLVNGFRGRDNRVHFFEAAWETDETYVAKLARLHTFYDEVERPKSIFAISLGAALAVSLTMERPEIETAHVVCGKITGSEKIGEHFRKRAPAIMETVRQSEADLADGLDPGRFIAYVPKGPDDGVIETVDMVVPEARIVSLPRLNHVTAIGYALVRYLSQV